MPEFHCIFSWNDLWVSHWQVPPQQMSFYAPCWITASWSTLSDLRWFDLFGRMLAPKPWYCQTDSAYVDPAHCVAWVCSSQIWIPSSNWSAACRTSSVPLLDLPENALAKFYTPIVHNKLVWWKAIRVTMKISQEGREWTQNRTDDSASRYLKM